MDCPMAVVLSEKRKRNRILQPSHWILSTNFNATFVVLLTTNWFQRCSRTLRAGAGLLKIMGVLLVWTTKMLFCSPQIMLLLSKKVANNVLSGTRASTIQSHFPLHGSQGSVLCRGIGSIFSSRGSYCSVADATEMTIKCQRHSLLGRSKSMLPW